MDKYVDLGASNEDSFRDMNVDFDLFEKTGDLPEHLIEADINESINNLNDWV